MQQHRLELEEDNPSVGFRKLERRDSQFNLPRFSDALFSLFDVRESEKRLMRPVQLILKFMKQSQPVLERLVWFPGLTVKVRLYSSF